MYYGKNRFLPFPGEIQRICVRDHVDTREYLSFKLMFDLSKNLWEDLTPGFSKTWVYLISQIEES